MFDYGKFTLHHCDWFNIILALISYAIQALPPGYIVKQSASIQELPAHT